MPTGKTDNVEPGKRGPKPWTPTEEDIQRIESLAASGLTNEEIYSALGISCATFYKNKAENPEISKAIKDGKAKAHAMVHSKLMALINGVMVKDSKGAVYYTPPNLGAIIWYEKTRRGMSDRVSVDANVGLTVVWDKEIEEI